MLDGRSHIARRIDRVDPDKVAEKTDGLDFINLRENAFGAGSNGRFKNVEIWSYWRDGCSAFFITWTVRSPLPGGVAPSG